MKVTIIGTGSMARALGTRAVVGGHTVQLIGRTLQSSAALANHLSAFDGGGAIDAAEIGDSPAGEVIVPAVPYDAVSGVLDQMAGHLGGRVIIDICNPIDWRTRDSLVVPRGSSAAEQIQGCPGAAGAVVVKAFNTIFAGNLEKGAGAGQPLDTLIAGDDEAAKRMVARLAADGGIRAVDVGPLRRARELEAFQLLHIAVQHALPQPYSSAIRLLY